MMFNKYFYLTFYITIFCTKSMNKNVEKNKKALIVSTLKYSTLNDIILKSVKETLLRKNINIDFVIVDKTNDEIFNNNEYYKIIKFNDFNKEKDDIIDKLKEFDSFDFTVQTDENAVDILGYINSKLNFKGIKLSDSMKFRNKVIMKHLLNEFIKKPKLYNFEDIENINNFPIVLKPKDSAGSDGVSFLNSKSELLNIISELKNKDILENYEIEEYISAPICHIDGLICKNFIVYCSASEYIGDCYNYLLGQPLGSVRCQEKQQERALILSKKVHKSLNFPDGVFHMEAFWKDDDFIFLEVGIRPGGAEVIPAIEEATGINLSIEHVLLQLGIENRRILNLYNYYGWLNFPSTHIKKDILKIKNIIFPNELKMPSLRRKYCPNINDEIDKTSVVYAQKLGAFVFASDNRDEILKDIEYCKKEYKVEFY